MKHALLVLVLVLSGCGSTTAARGPEEVTATWTEGDDAPLESAPTSSPKTKGRDDHGDQPGRRST